MNQRVKSLRITQDSISGTTGNVSWSGRKLAPAGLITILPLVGLKMPGSQMLNANQFQREQATLPDLRHSTLTGSRN